MLINDLVRAYDRLVLDPNCEINQDGFCFGVIDNLVLIDKDGGLVDIVSPKDSLRESLPENLCPGGVKRNVLYDSMEYFFGLKIEGDELTIAIDGKSKDRSSKFENFKNANLELLGDVDCEMARAIKSYLEEWNPEEKLHSDFFYALDADGNRKPKVFKGNFSFCLLGINAKCYKDEAILNKIRQNRASKNTQMIPDGICCISGERSKIASKHKSFSGSQNFLISVDNDTKSFHSYGKTWSYDSSVSEEVMNKYTAVLNYFYRSGSKNKVSFGEDTLMFWAESDGNYQDEFLMLLGQTPSTNEEESTEEIIISSLKQMKSGITPNAFKTPPDTNYYLLLLSKNSARFAVRKYHRTTFGKLRDNLLQHYMDMEIVGIEKPIAIWQLLAATVSTSSNDKPQPSFGGALTDSIINNWSYPAAMFAQMIKRIKTDNPSIGNNAQKRSIFISATNKRIAFIKAYLTRKNRIEIIRRT